MKLVRQNHWIYDAASAGNPWTRERSVADVQRLLHGMGCMWVARKQDELLIKFDGRLFGAARCARLIAEIDRMADRVGTYEFSVWSGAVEPGTWVRYTATSAAEARSYAELVCAIAPVSGAARTITATELSFERLLLERRGLFDEVIAAWLLSRGPEAGAVGRLFGPSREKADEGLKVVRRFGDSLRFDSYRTPIGHTWTPDQAARMIGSDLHTVPDRRLAQTLYSSAERVAASRAPVLERIRGAFLVEASVAITEYFRLSLPLPVDGRGRTDTFLIATRW